MSLPGPSRSDTQKLTRTRADVEYGEVSQSLRFHLAQQRRLQGVRVAHPTVHELKLADTVFVLVRRVVTGVDVFEPVTALPKLIEHLGPLLLCATSVFSVSLWFSNYQNTTETQRTLRLHRESPLVNSRASGPRA